MQGPTFLIEFDNTQNDGNHVHSIWRDFKGDFGRDLLREHIKTAHQAAVQSGRDAIRVHGGRDRSWSFGQARL